MPGPYRMKAFAVRTSKHPHPCTHWKHDIVSPSPFESRCDRFLPHSSPDSNNVSSQHHRGRRVLQQVNVAEVHPRNLRRATKWRLLECRNNPSGNRQAVPRRG